MASSMFFFFTRVGRDSFRLARHLAIIKYSSSIAAFCGGPLGVDRDRPRSSGCRGGAQCALWVLERPSGLQMGFMQERCTNSAKPHALEL